EMAEQSADSALSALIAHLERTLTTAATPDQMLAAIDGVAGLKATLRRLDHLVEARAIAWIEAHGDLTCGDIRYYVGQDKKTKCRDPKATLQALLDATGGDLDAVVGHLSAGAFKHGACRATLPSERYEALFETTATPDLKTGKPLRVLAKLDTRFAPGA